MEEANFPLDRVQVNTALQGLRQSTEESSAPRRIDDQEDELDNPGRTPERRPIEEQVSVQNRVEITDPAGQQGGTDFQGRTAADQNTDIAEAERRELQSNRQEITNNESEASDIQQENSADAQTVARNVRSQGAAGLNELGRVSESAVQDPQEQLGGELSSGNQLTDTERLDEFQTSSQIGDVREQLASANSGTTNNSVEFAENEATPFDEPPSIRDLGEDGTALQTRGRLEESFNSDPAPQQERSAAELEEAGASPNDARIQQRIQEERAAEAETRARNEPALDTPNQTIEPLEDLPDPVQDGLDINPLRGPRLSEIREDDSTSTETERGQNVNNLI